MSSLIHRINLTSLFIKYFSAPKIEDLCSEKEEEEVEPYHFLIYRLFHKTLPRSSAFINGISVRFYETDQHYMYLIQYRRQVVPQSSVHSVTSWTTCLRYCINVVSIIYQFNHSQASQAFTFKFHFSSKNGTQFSVHKSTERQVQITVFVLKRHVSC